MKREANVKQVEAPDVNAMWSMSGPMFEDAGKMYRAWLEGTQRMQVEAVDFFNERVGKDMAMLSECGRCTTAAEVLEVQARYGSDAMNDYVTESQRLLALMGNTTFAAK